MTGICQTAQNRNQMAKGGAFPCIVNIWPTTSLSGTPTAGTRSGAGSLCTALVKSSDLAKSSTSSIISTTSAYHVDALAKGASCFTSPTSSIRSLTDDSPSGKAAELKSTLPMSPFVRKPTSRLSAALKAQPHLSTVSTSSLPIHIQQLCSPELTSPPANAICATVRSDCAPSALAPGTGAPGTTAHGPVPADYGCAHHSHQRATSNTARPTAPPTCPSQKLQAPPPAQPPPTNGPPHTTPAADSEAPVWGAGVAAPAGSTADSVSEVWDSLPCFSPSLVDRLWAGRAGSSGSNTSPPTVVMPIRRNHGVGAARDVGHAPGHIIAASLPTHKVQQQQQQLTIRNRAVHHHHRGGASQPPAPCFQQGQQSALPPTSHQQNRQQQEHQEVISGSVMPVLGQEACFGSDDVNQSGPVRPARIWREEDLANAAVSEADVHDDVTVSVAAVAARTPQQQQPPLAEMKLRSLTQGGNTQSPGTGIILQQTPQTPPMLTLQHQHSLRDSASRRTCLEFVAAAAAAAPAPRALGAACAHRHHHPQHEAVGSLGGSMTAAMDYLMGPTPIASVALSSLRGEEATGLHPINLEAAAGMSETECQVIVTESNAQGSWFPTAPASADTKAAIGMVPVAFSPESLHRINTPHNVVGSILRQNRTDCSTLARSGVEARALTVGTGRPVSCGASAATASAAAAVTTSDGRVYGGCCGNGRCGAYATGSPVSQTSTDWDPSLPSGRTCGSPSASSCLNSGLAMSVGGRGGVCVRRGSDVRTQWWGMTGFFSEDRTTAANNSDNSTVVSSQRRVEVAAAAHTRGLGGRERRDGGGVGERGGGFGRGGAAGMSRVHWLRW